MANDGVITRKDIITDDALNWGPDYAKQMTTAISSNKEFASTLKEINKQANDFRNAKGQTEYIELKNQQALANKKVLDSIKKLEAAELAAQKIKQAKIKTDKDALTLSDKEAASKKRNTKLTAEERVQLEISNRAAKQAALERLGLIGAYTKLNAERTKAKKVLLDLLAAENQDAKAIQKATSEFDKLNKRVLAADHAVGDFTKSVGNYPKLTGFTNGIKNLVGAFGLVGGVTAFASVITSAFQLTKELQSLDLALLSVTGSQEEFNKQQSFLKALAQENGQEINSLTKQFTSFYVAAKDKLSGKEIQQIFSDISKSGSALGLSNEALERSFTAVNQMLSKGTVSSEELRGQLAESLPGAVQAMTKAVQKLNPEIKNLTEKGLFEMIKNGEILANEVLPETAKQLAIITNAENASKVDTLAKATNRLSNQWTEFVRSLNEADASGFSKFVKTITNGLGNILDFTSLLFKDENQLQKYFQNLGKAEGLQQYEAILKNISTTSKENQEATKKELLARERENIRVNQAIIKSEKEKRASIIGGNRALFHLQTKAEEDALKQLGKSAAIIKALKEDSVSDDIKKAKAVKELTQKEKDALEKSERDRLNRLKALSDTEFNYQKEILERNIKVNQEIADDQDIKDDMRISSLQNVKDLQFELIELTKKNQLDYDKFVLDNEKLNSDQKLLIQYQAYGKQVDAAEKFQKDLKKIREFDDEEYSKSLAKQLSQNEIAQNEELKRENEGFQELLNAEDITNKERERRIEDHERNVFEIKKRYAIEALKIQISNLESELAASDKLPKDEQLSAEKRLEIANKLSKAKLDLSEVELDENKKKNDKEVMSAREQAEVLLQISSDLTGALSDLASALFEGKIQKIDAEIEKNNEYYDSQIEAAGDNEKQVDLLEKERDKKNKVLEEKKKKEQRRQAVYNKAAALAQASISTALAVLAALSTQPFLPLGPAMAILAGVLGGIQIAAIAATPIPKYKMGRRGGPAETAIVGDGGVPEVIERRNGKVELTPSKDTLVQLAEGDNVYKDIEDYKRNGRMSVMNSLGLEQKKVNEYFNVTMNADKYGPEIVKEMKLTRKAISNLKLNVPKQKMLDLNHEIWKIKNIKS